MTNIGFIIVFLLGGYFFGRYNEKKHYQNIIDREKRIRLLPVSSFTWKERKKSNPPPNYENSQLFIGETVIASDYFKTFVGGLRSIIGGRLKSYESLLDRGRREAVLRLLESSKRWGAKEVINLRIETSNVNSSAGSKKKGMPIIEVFAYGTALK